MSEGWIVAALGLGLRAWSWRELHAAGMHTDDLESNVKPQHVRWVKSGPYRVMRHPMYFGWFLMVLGTALVFTPNIGLAFVIAYAGSQHSIWRARVEAHQWKESEADPVGARAN